jgi:hypothetical protein
MRDLRKVDVKSAVFSVPHSKEIEQMLTMRMLAHTCAGHFGEQPVCVAFISRHNAGPEGSRAVARIGYHRNVRGGAARIPLHP